MGKHNAEASRRGIDNEILKPSMARPQRDLAQLEHKHEHHGTQQIQVQTPRIGEPKRRPSQPKDKEMLKIVMEVRYWTLSRRHNGYDE